MADLSTQASQPRGFKRSRTKGKSQRVCSELLNTMPAAFRHSHLLYERKLDFAESRSLGEGGFWRLPVFIVNKFWQILYNLMSIFDSRRF